MATYSEMLRDPRWQRKRLEIMQRDDFKCSDCGAANRTLNVHHDYYTKGAMPWEYPNESLRCLCETCHEWRHDIMQNIMEEISNCGELYYLEMVLGYAKGLWAKSGDDTVERSIRVFSYGEASGVTDAYGLPWDGAMGPDAVCSEAGEDCWISHTRLKEIRDEFHRQIAEAQKS